jgi:hypothetical protein
MILIFLLNWHKLKESFNRLIINPLSRFIKEFTQKKVKYIVLVNYYMKCVVLMINIKKKIILDIFKMFLNIKTIKKKLILPLDTLLSYKGI